MISLLYHRMQGRKTLIFWK